MNINEYLTRFDALPYQDVSLENLTQLQHHHLLHVPFENFDVVRRVPIYLNLQTIYSKIVTHRRGGYCYELNGLFQWLLTELGYTSHLISATVMKPTGEWAKTDTHAAILVQLDQPYLVDVGFGAATPRLPIPLDGITREDIAASYTVQKVNDHQYDLIQKKDDQHRTLYRFSTKEKQLIDFHEGCTYNQVSKESTFTHHDIITQATSNGRVTLSDHTFTKVENGQTETSELTKEQKQEVLLEVFNIRL